MSDGLRQSKADDVKIGDIVRRSHRGVQTGIPWRVTEVGERRIQHYWGFWYRELWLESTTSKRKTVLGTWEVVVLGHND